MFFSCLRLISRMHEFPKIVFYKNNALYKLSLMRHNLHWIPLLLFFPVGYYSGGLGGHHVLCYGCSLLLQFHLLHPPDNSEWLWAELGRPGLVYESITRTVTNRHTGSDVTLCQTGFRQLRRQRQENHILNIFFKMTMFLQNFTKFCHNLQI